MTIDQERQYRFEIWNVLISEGGPSGVRPQLLRDLGIYGGAQGVWVDKARTSSIVPGGLTVALLHTGSSYPDDLSADGVLYHYPNTNRPVARDKGEIKATKMAGSLETPIFVITYPSPNSTTRDVHLGWVEGWDDRSELFLVSFDTSPPERLITEPDDEGEFNLTDNIERSTAETPVRPNQQRFRFQVLQRYGPQCAVCDISAPQLLDAIHIRPRSKNGSDDSRNGLILCANHHRAFDSGLFKFEPETLRIVYRDHDLTREDLGISRQDLQHLDRKPHPEAIQWQWNS